MNESNEENKPLKLRAMDISADEMDYLSNYWEIRDHMELFKIGVKLFHDLTKLDQAGFLLTFHKGNINETTKTTNYTEDYKGISFLMKWLIPTEDKFPRLPTPEMLEKICKIEKS